MPVDGLEVGYGHKDGVGLWTICCSGGNFLPVGRAVDEVLIGLASFIRSRKGDFPADREEELIRFICVGRRSFGAHTCYSPRIEK